MITATIIIVYFAINIILLITGFMIGKNDPNAVSTYNLQDFDVIDALAIILFGSLILVIVLIDNLK